MSAPSLFDPDRPADSSTSAFKRYRCVRSTVVRLVARPHFQACRASVAEVSSREIALILDRSFDEGTVLAVLFQSQHAGISGILSATVKSARSIDGSRWLLDCTLSRALTEDEIFALI